MGAIYELYWCHKDFIRTERTGNLDEHLTATQEMLNLHATTNHFNYAKSTRLYRQTMLRLEYDFRWLHRQFKENEFHCVWRSDNCWTEIWVDLTKEKTMLRLIKSLGGLTRGIEINEAVRILWIGKLHRCSEI